MPFTIDGQWVPGKQQLQSGESKPSKPVKVRLIKRGKSTLTVVLNLNLEADKLAELASDIKKKLGCGGAVKDDVIEIQGDKVESVKNFLLIKKIKST